VLGTGVAMQRELLVTGDVVTRASARVCCPFGASVFADAIVKTRCQASLALRQRVPIEPRMVAVTMLMVVPVVVTSMIVVTKFMLVPLVVAWADMVTIFIITIIITFCIIIIIVTIVTILIVICVPMGVPMGVMMARVQTVEVH